MFEELKKTYRPEFINRIDEKVVFHSLSSEDMQQVVKVMVKPLIATLAEQGMTLKFQPSALKLLATKGTIQKWELAHSVVSCRPKWKIN